MIEEIYKLYRQNYIVDTDTRSIREGSIFFALKGENFNGNKFVLSALEQGAKHAISSDNQFTNHPNITVVNDTLVVLQELAKYHRNQLKIPFLSLTGSNGKTTTKELINTVLSKKYKTLATKGNLNNHIGVPLTILSITHDTEFAIIEMGANHQKEIEFLSSISQPDFGYITNFGKAHLEGFGGVEGVIKGKSELYDYLRINNRVAFINCENEKQMERAEGIEKICFTNNLELNNADPFISIKYNGADYKTHLIGEYNYTNIAAAVTVGEYFDVDSEKIVQAITDYIPDNNRSQILSKNGYNIILDAYNANPSSMEVAILNFSNLKQEDKVLILGDMFELGDSSQQEHQNIANLATQSSVSKVILVGKHFYNIENTEALKYPNFEALEQDLKAILPENTNLLIKGSRGMALERIIELL